MAKINIWEPTIQVPKGITQREKLVGWIRNSRVEGKLAWGKIARARGY
jgi:hypothetical protein